MRQEALILLSCCLISSGLTYCGVKGVYTELHRSELAKMETETIGTIVMTRKLAECSYNYGLFVATKGKHGHEYFEKRP